MTGDRAYCGICDIYVDSAGCHLQDGSAATPDSDGWFCNHCKTRVRRHPADDTQTGDPAHDSRPEDVPEYTRATDNFGEYRISILKRLGACLPPRGTGLDMRDVPRLIEGRIRPGEIEREFGCGPEALVEIAYSDIPNKVAMIVELEQIKTKMGRAPGVEEIDRHSRFTKAEYEAEFGPLDDLPVRLGYEPPDTHHADAPVHQRGKQDARDRHRTAYDVLSAVRSSWGGIDVYQLGVRLGIPHEMTESLCEDLDDAGCVRMTSSGMVFWNECEGAPTGHDRGEPDAGTGYGDDEWKRIVTDALEIIRANSYYIRLSYLGVSMSIPYNMLPELRSRITREGTLSYRDDGDLLYDQGPKKSSGNDRGYFIPRLTEMMNGQYKTVKELDAGQCERLTKEYEECGSMARVIADNPDLNSWTVMLSVKTLLRLPPELRSMVEGGRLHPDPGMASRIVYFVINHLEWDGGEGEKDVIKMARDISEYVQASRAARRDPGQG